MHGQHAQQQDQQQHGERAGERTQGKSGEKTEAGKDAEDRADRRDVTLAFFNNEGTVRPLAYSAAIKDLKALIHNL